MDDRDEPRPIVRLIVPVVLAITIVGTVVALSTSTSGCGDNTPPDAAVVDGAPDTPIV